MGVLRARDDDADWWLSGVLDDQAGTRRCRATGSGVSASRAGSDRVDTIRVMDDLRIKTALGVTVVSVRVNIIDSVGQTLRRHDDLGGVEQVLLVSDRCVAGLYGSRVLESLERSGFRTHEFLIHPGENSKSLAVAGEMFEALARHRIGRDGLVVALGGGVVSDVAGFVAATWMRGIRFAICPTTLEADVDASIGGKTGVNIAAGKNLVGAFHPPTVVAIDPLCLRTLPARDIRAGLAESIKHALIAAPERFDWHEQHADRIMALDESITTELIDFNLRIKGAIVERDAFERSGVRLLLNFGHTVGHAIESCAGYALRHGECVGLGMLAACRISRAMGLLDSSDVDRVLSLLRRFELPTQLDQAIDTDDILARIRNDKKCVGGRVQFVLLEGIGRPVVRDDVSDDLVREAYESLLS